MNLRNSLFAGLSLFTSIVAQAGAAVPVVETPDDQMRKLAQSYPGTPVPMQQASRLLRETPDPVKAFKIENAGSLYACKSMDYFSVSKKLVETLPSLSKELQSKASKLLLARAETEMSAPTVLLPLLLQSDIVIRIADAGTVSRLSSQRAEIQDAHKKSMDLRDQIRDEIKKTPKDRYLKAWSDESILAKRGADPWLKILKKAENTP